MIKINLLKIFFLAFSILVLIPFISSAHFLVGLVNDARDGTLANDREVVLWNPSFGINDNLTDIIGPSGNSGVDNLYLIDCELLSNGCEVGEELRVMVYNSSNKYTTNFTTITVSGSGFDVFANLTLNSPPNVSSINVDDSLIPLSFPANQIDLTAASNTSVNCTLIVEEFDGDSLYNITSEFFDNTTSFYGDNDDNNYHYTNESCFVNNGYGNENQTEIICSFELAYYSNFGGWNCFVSLMDSYSFNNSNNDNTYVNSLLSVGVSSIVNFGNIQATNVSSESIVNVTNYGNVLINLSLYGYGITPGDNLSMACSSANISIGYTKYNLTEANSGEINLTSFSLLYSNLTSDLTNRKFNLNSRQDDSFNDALNDSYWRIYAPSGVSGSCQGNIVFGASQYNGV